MAGTGDGDKNSTGFVSAGAMRMLLGGTANMAVLGGNLPPSFGTANFRMKRAGWAQQTQRAGGPFHRQTQAATIIQL